MKEDMKSIKSIFLGFLDEKCSYETYIKMKDLYRRIRRKSYNACETYVMNPKWGKKCKKYYVLRFSSPIFGPLAIARNLLCIYPWAEEHGYILLIEYCYRDDFEKEIYPRINFWEKLFVQENSVEKLLEMKEQIIFESVDYFRKDRVSSKFLRTLNDEKNEFQYKYLGGSTGKEYYRKWKKVSEKCLELAPQITQIKDSLGYLFENGGETIAVIFRAGFTKAYYDKTSKENQEALSYHARVPDVDKTLGLLDDYLSKKRYKYIFFCCEEQEIVERFKIKYKNKLVSIERERYMNSYPPVVGMDADNIKEVFSEEILMSQYVPYLQEVYIASKCKYLFGCVCSGTLMALIWNSGCYEDVYILPDENPNSGY